MCRQRNSTAKMQEINDMENGALLNQGNVNNQNDCKCSSSNPRSLNTGQESSV